MIMPLNFGPALWFHGCIIRLLFNLLVKISWVAHVHMSNDLYVVTRCSPLDR